MKLVTFQANGKERLGAWLDQNIFDLNLCYLFYLMGITGDRIKHVDSETLQKLEAKANDEMPSSMIEFLNLGDQAMQRAGKVLKRMADFSASDLPYGAIYKLDDISIKAPIQRPGKILCLAGNYAEHVREGGRTFAGKEKMAPRVFMKPNTAVIGMGDAIALPKKGNKIDWEAELAVVIGKKGKYINAESAYDYIAGYTIMNDVSERELIIEVEREPSEWNRFFDWLNGKWMDTFAPMGPCIVTRDKIEDPHALKIQLHVNDQIRQNSNTGNMIFQIPELVEFISRLMTLEPGDIIATGTPAGVGSVSGVFLKKGDIVEIEIQDIGLLRNVVEAE